LQAFWRLAGPVADWHPVEKLNADIARQLGGDACHNVDRLMRVPGFVNFPSASKRKRGRLPVMAGWGQVDSGAAYRLGELEASFALSAAPGGGVLVEGPPRHERLSDEELIARCQNNENWHNSMIVLTARLVQRGLSDEDILLFAPRIALYDFSEDQTCADMRVAIRGARKKWDRVANQANSRSKQLSPSEGQRNLMMRSFGDVKMQAID
jgi:hypothetical protein